MAAVDWFIIFVCSAMFVGRHTTVAGQPEKPSNISCVWKAKRIFTCDFLFGDGEPVDEYTCSVCPHFRSNNSSNGTCPQYLSHDKGCPTSAGRCEYDCDKEGYCRESLMIRITPPMNTSVESSSWCRLIDIINYVKPGPVHNLTLIPRNSFTLDVKWRKPADKDNYDDVYIYQVYCAQNITYSTRKKRSGKDEVEVKCRHLLPNQRYNVTVRARMKHGGYWSIPQTASASTPESVPKSGPVVPEGSFAVINQDQLLIYWSAVPVLKQGGDIQQYSVSVDQCMNITVAASRYWTFVNRSRCGPGTYEVRTYAATRVGWSRTPFVRRIYTYLFDMNHVQYVYKTNEEVVWEYPTDKLIESFTVYWCYGHQDDKHPQLVKCQTAIDWMTIPPGRRRISLTRQDTPSVSCSLCEWHYAVSVNINNISTGMVWDSANRTDTGRVLADIADSGEDNTVKTMIMVTLALVAGLCLAVISIIVVVLYRKNMICERIIIVLPKLESFDTNDTDETSFSLKTSKATNAEWRKLIKPLLRDSGNISMETGKNCSGSNGRSPLRYARAKDIVEENKEMSLCLSPSEDSQGMSTGIVPGLHLHDVAIGDDLWLSGDTSGMSDYRQVACSGNELETKLDVSTSSKLGPDLTDCPSAQVISDDFCHTHPKSSRRPADHSPVKPSYVSTGSLQSQTSDLQRGEHAFKTLPVVETRPSNREKDRSEICTPLLHSVQYKSENIPGNVSSEVKNPVQQCGHPRTSVRLSTGTESIFLLGKTSSVRNSGSGDETSVGSYAAMVCERI